jgi:hypothetical protein
MGVEQIREIDMGFSTLGLVCKEEHLEFYTVFYWEPMYFVITIGREDSMNCGCSGRQINLVL